MTKIEDSLTHVSELVEKQLHQWNLGEKKKSTSKKAPVITISREYGTMGAAIGEKLAKKLKFSFWHQNIVHTIAKHSGLNKNLANSLDEKTHNLIDDLITGIMLGKEATERGYLEELIKTIHTIGQHSNSIIIGRGSQFILGKKAFRVRIVAPLEVRIQLLHELHQLSPQSAKQKILTIDKERIDFHLKHFQKNIQNPELYDVCLNIEKISIEESVNILAENYKLFTKKTH